jgi:hypothetical protein
MEVGATPPEDPDLFIKICSILRLTGLLNQEDSDYVHPFQQSTSLIPEEDLPDFHSLEAVSAILTIGYEVISTSYISSPSPIVHTEQFDTDMDVSIEDAEASLDVAEADVSAAQVIVGADLEDNEDCEGDVDTSFEGIDTPSNDTDPGEVDTVSSNKPADGPHEEVNIAEPVPQLGHPLQVAVVPNPTSQAAASNNLNDHKLRLLDTKTATNLWPNVKKNEWYCMFRYVFCHQCIHSFEFDPLDI